MSLDSLAQEVGGNIPPILGIGGIMVNPEGFVMMNVQIPCVKGYNDSWAGEEIASSPPWNRHTKCLHYVSRGQQQDRGGIEK